MDNNMSPYKLVHLVSKLAKEMEDEDRELFPDQKNNLYKEVNKTKKRRNYVLEAFNELKNEKADDSNAK